MCVSCVSITDTSPDTCGSTEQTLRIDNGMKIGTQLLQNAAVHLCMRTLKAGPHLPSSAH